MMGAGEAFLLYFSFLCLLAQPPASASRGIDTMESVLAELASVYEGKGNITLFALEHHITLVNSRARVVVELCREGSVPSDLGIVEESRFENLIQALVPISNLSRLAQAPCVANIRLPRPSIPISEGRSCLVAMIILCSSFHFAGSTGRRQSRR